MAVSSPLNPASIARERSTTAAAAQNFITGGSPLGEGVVASAANKIVGFQRGAAAVAARPPDLQGIIQTLSTNILNNVENRVQSINQNVTQIVNKSIVGLERSYKERLDKIDAARPNSILQNFLNLYKEALGYIQFLGNRKNVRTLGDNLKTLQNVFTETFNIAKIIRQTIIKIVNQLSNLPTATGGGGGLNLDVNVPGGGLKKSAPSGLMRMMRRRPGMMLGGAALAGGLGSQVVSGMLDVGGDVQAAPMGEGTIPTSLLDRFNGILDRFSAAISSLSNVKRSQPSSGSGRSGAPPPPKEGTSGGGGGGGVLPTSSGSEDMMTLATIAALESGSAQGQADVAQSVYNRLRDPAYKGKSIKDLLTKQGQYQVAFKDPTASSGKGTEIADEFKNIKTEDDGVKAMMSYYNKRGQKITSEQARQKFRGAVAAIQNQDLQKKAAQYVGGRTEFLGAGSNPSGAVWRGSGSDNKFFAEYGNKSRNLQMGAAPIPTGLFASSTTATTTPTKSNVTAAQTQATTAQQVAQTVARPPMQQTPQVTVAPMDMTSPQAQSTKVGDKVIPPPQMTSGGLSVPFFTSSNNDNFLTLYSKLVYNVVDG